MKDVATRLAMPQSFLHAILLKWKIPTRLCSPRRGVQLFTKPLPATPSLYTLYKKIVDDNMLFMDEYLEFLFPLQPYHFDFQFLMRERFRNMTDERFRVLTSDWYQHQPTFDHLCLDMLFDDPTRNDWRQKMCDYVRDIPQAIASLNNDELFQANSDLAVAFLYGSVCCPIAGIAPPHLKGQFLLGLRQAGTGYLSVNRTRSSDILGSDKWNAILEWFRVNNRLYRDWTPYTEENVDIRLDPLISSSEVVSVEVPGGTTGMTNHQGAVSLIIRNSDGSRTYKYVPLELALSLSFPLLFPFGIPDIPARTLRKKSRLLLASHPYYRCGRLACHLTLFLYHVIQDHTLSFARNKLSVQPLQVPPGTNRDMDGQVLANDPSSPSYWRARQSEVRGLCRQYGDPDLMVTFTFVNKWDEVDAIKNSITEQTGRTLDLRFCPLEEMLIWRSRFTDVKEQDFNLLTIALGFGPVKHYTWRLEFQARGAPHVHALLWLQTSLSLETLSTSMFGHIPSSATPKLQTYVTANMSHTCNVWRCQRGDPTSNCRYGFPKPACASVHLTDEGGVVFARSPTDKWTVDYSPSFLCKWRGHCHINILKTDAQQSVSTNAIHYIVKYNFKEEPSLRVEIGRDDTYDTLFHARIISSEEAIARIFSFHFYGCDTTFDYISLQPPETRRAAFVAGVQLQVPSIERYFLRPLALDQLPIGAFYSLYELEASSQTHGQRSRSAEFSSIHPPHRLRPRNTLIDGSWEEHNLFPLSFIASAPLFPAHDLPDAKALDCHLRSQPKIVLTQKFVFNCDPEQFAYAYLLLHGCWRSDSELRANCSSWLSALFFHGLILPELPEISGYQCRLIDYMIDSFRYSAYDIAYTVCRLTPDAQAYISQLLSSSQTTRPVRALLEQVVALMPNQQTSTNLPNNPIDDCTSMKSYIACDFTDDEKSSAQQTLATKVPLMNADQKVIYSHIETCLHSNCAFTIFVQGKAGTGKSFLINCLQALFTIRNTTFVTCASTGIAASLINGRTLHSVFGLYTDSSGQTLCSLDLGRPRGNAISHCRVIIVDEITMISRAVLDSLDNGLRQLAHGQELFIYQFPLKLCWAVTAHKSQGQSLERVAIDISEPAFAHGALYVALSRVRSLSSLLLFGLETFPNDGPLFHRNPFIQEQEDDGAIIDA